MRVLKRMVPVLALAGGLAVTANEASAASLRGSPASMREQNTVARQHELAFYRTTADIHAAVERGELVALTGNENYEVADFVRHPFAHESVRLFIERISAQYREACGQKLVVTSAVRPSSGQPRNAHALSVHPAGMAVDLRVSDSATCRSWLEGALMNLERAGVLNGIREFHPPHYHVAVYPEQYMAWAAERAKEEAAAAAAAAAEAKAEVQARPAIVSGGPVRATVQEATSAPLGQRVVAAAAVMIVLALPLGTQMLGRRRNDSV